MIGLGTIVNTITVLVGGLLGLRFGKRVPDQMRDAVVKVIGLATIAIGLRDVLRTDNMIFPLLGMIVGVIIGEALRVEERISGVGERLQRRFAANTDSSNFVSGFLTASLLYVVGPLTVLGAIEDGSGSTPNLYLIKASLDGFMSVVFASVYGVGVLFSALSVLVVQGGLTIAGLQVGNLLVPRIESELYAAGGLAVVGIGLNLLGIAKLRVGSMLPGLVCTPVLVGLFADGLRPW